MTGYYLVLCLYFFFNQLRKYEEQISFSKLISKSSSELANSYGYI